MQAIIFIGIQASGKSTFYKQHFFNTHVRISLDLLRTRHRESLFIQTCYNSLMRFVIDNTNTNITKRQRYIREAKQHKYRVTGYFFDTSLDEALQRNLNRSGKEVIPEKGIRATFKRLVIPRIEEGFDELYRVTIDRTGFRVERMGERA